MIKISKVFKYEESFGELSIKSKELGGMGMGQTSI
jgi:hypothetical protein